MKGLVISALLMGSCMAQAQEWNKDLDSAMRQAAAEDKTVLLFFSVPENCAICESLEKNVLKSNEFITYAQTHFVLARPDFDDAVPVETKTDNLLIIEKYNKDGFFPLVVLLDKNARVLGKAGIYNEETPAQYLHLLQSITRR